MVILVVSIILLMGLAIVDRHVNRKKDKNGNIIKMMIRIMMICLLFLISYLVTDTIRGLLYVFSTACIYIILILADNRYTGNWINYLINILGIPVFGCLLLNTIHHILINPFVMIFPILLTGGVFRNSYEKEHSMRDCISFIVGIAIAIALAFSYYESSESETKNKNMYKQEIVAKNFLEEELGLYGLNIYTSNRKLRGQDTIVRAYNSSGTSITMIYRNNKIISYNIEK